MRLRLGSLLRGLSKAATIATDLTSVLEADGIKVPDQAKKLTEGLNNAKELVGVALGEGGGLHEIDAAFDLAHDTDAQVVLLVLAADGSELKRVEFSDFARDAADAAFDRLDKAFD